MRMDNIDRSILRIIQTTFPFDRRPYKKIAEDTGISEEEALGRIERLKSSGIIRRIGAIINPRRIGWVSTLCAADVKPGMIETYASVVNAFPEVTHNYVRVGSPNCWFTIIAPDEKRCKDIIHEISSMLGIELIDLPARRVFKIDVQFRL